MFSRSDLDELVAMEARPAVSLYLPTHVAGREIRQDPVRFKNLLSQAAERLRTIRRGTDTALLASARHLIDDAAFWRHQQQGLALFLAPDFLRVHKLPIKVPEEVIVGRHFYIKPLLPLLDDAGPFWLLTISASGARFFQGSRWNFAEVPGVDLPQGVAAVRAETEYQETHYAAPTGRRGGLAKAQSFGDDPDQVRKDELLEFLHRIKSLIESVIKRNPAPVIVAAHPEVQGHFREIAGWKEIHPDGLLGNPDVLTSEELHRRAYAMLEERQTEACKAAIDRLNARRRIGKATTTPEEIVKAARYSRVDHLFLCGDEHLWGKFHETSDHVVPHGSAGEGDIDLLDYAALMTLRHGGSVSLVKRTALPSPGLAAAILRY